MIAILWQNASDGFEGSPRVWAYHSPGEGGRPSGTVTVLFTDLVRELGQALIAARELAMVRIDRDAIALLG